MSLSFKNRERLYRLFVVVNSPLVVVTGIIAALAILALGLYLGNWITALFGLSSAVIDFLRMRWLKARGLWGASR